MLKAWDDLALMLAGREENGCRIHFGETADRNCDGLDVGDEEKIWKEWNQEWTRRLVIIEFTEMKYLIYSSQ